MVDIQSATAEIRREKEEEEEEEEDRNHRAKIQCPHLLSRAAIMRDWLKNSMYKANAKAKASDHKI